MGQQAEAAGIRSQVLKHLRVVRVVGSGIVERKVRKAIVVLADVDVREGRHAVPIVIVAPKPSDATAAFKRVNVKAVLLRRLDCGQSTHACANDTHSNAILRWSRGRAAAAGRGCGSSAIAHCFAAARAVDTRACNQTD